MASTPERRRRAAPAAPCVLLTGFEPFGGEAVNSSWAAAQGLHGAQLHGLHGHRVQAVQLPCRFASSLAVLDAALRRHRPVLVLALGQAASRQALSFERVAINWVDARIPDNDGLQPLDEAVHAGAPAAYFSRLPLKAMVAAVQAEGVPAEISFTAGSYVCNQVFFGLQHRLRRQPAVRSGFLHVPALGADWSAERIAQGVRAALAAALAVPPGADDSGPSAGRID